MHPDLCPITGRFIVLSRDPVMHRLRAATDLTTDTTADRRRVTDRHKDTAAIPTRREVQIRLAPGTAAQMSDRRRGMEIPADRLREVAIILPDTAADHLLTEGKLTKNRDLKGFGFFYLKIK